MKSTIRVYSGQKLAQYHFGAQHPFGPQRQDAFVKRLESLGLDQQTQHGQPQVATQEVIELFHTHEYIERVKQYSATGEGYLDQGDTPAVKGIYEAAAAVVGTTVQAVDDIMSGAIKRAFVPIAGLHHARRDRAAGFCVFNDCGVAIEYLRRQYHIGKIAYVDIDAHHGDGVFYSFEDDPELCFVDLHEDGHYLYPGTGFVEETGQGQAVGTKLNIPMPMGADDEVFMRCWLAAEDFLQQARPEFILFQCGADSLAGDPITHLRYSAQAHAHAAARLCALADTYAQGRLLAMGGGGYHLENLAAAWTAVVQAFVDHS